METLVVVEGLFRAWGWDSSGAASHKDICTFYYNLRIL